MTNASVEFPTAHETDPAEVAMAVTTANTLWRQGESAEAIRWLRRAAEAAETTGDDTRALSLARIAAELQDDVEASRPTPEPPVREPSQRPPPPPSTPPVREPSQRPPSPSTRPPSMSSHPPPTAPSAIPAARVVSISKDGANPTVRAVPASNGSPPPRRPSEPPAAPVHRPEASQAPARRSDGQPAHPARSETHSAIRVSVEPSPDDRNVLLVRPLRDGEQPPIGAREALLVPLQSGVDLRYL